MVLQLVKKIQGLLWNFKIRYRIQNNLQLYPTLAHSNLSHTRIHFVLLSPHIRGGVDKSLVRPGRKEAIVTKLGIYSTHSPWSSINFFARCSNFCKPLRKNQKFVRPTRSPRQQWPPRRAKNGEISIVFKIQKTVGSPTGSDPKNRVGDQDTGNPGTPVSSGLRVAGEPGHCRTKKKKDPLGDFPAADVFPSKCPPIAPAEMSNTPRW